MGQDFGRILCGAQQAFYFRDGLSGESAEVLSREVVRVRFNARKLGFASGEEARKNQLVGHATVVEKNLDELRIFDKYDVLFHSIGPRNNLFNCSTDKGFCR